MGGGIAGGGAFGGLGFGPALPPELRPPLAAYAGLRPAPRLEDCEGERLIAPARR